MAMGSSISSVIVNIFMEHFEKEDLRKISEVPKNSKKSEV